MIFYQQWVIYNVEINNNYLFQRCKPNTIELDVKENQQNILHIIKIYEI